MSEPNAFAEPTIDETGIDCVVVDPLRFKQRLHIGEDAFALLRAKKNLFTIYETAGAAGTGGSRAALRSAWRAAHVASG